MNFDNYGVQLEKKLLRKEDGDCYYVFIIKIIDIESESVFNEIYTSINVNHGLILEKFNEFVYNIKKNINSIFEIRILGNLHKISYYDGTIVFKTEMYTPEKNYILVRLKLNDAMLDTLLEVNKFLKNK
jgi:hypothetical protein